MAYENLLLEKEEALAILYVNRPKALNALNKDTLLEMKDAITSIKNDPEIDVLIVTGAGGKSFVAGADIALCKTLLRLKDESLEH